jgi:hypothetical protein
MTKVLAIGVPTLFLLVGLTRPVAAVPQATGAAQQTTAVTSPPRPIEALLEPPRLDPTIRIASLKRQSTPISVVMDAIISITGLFVSYDESVPGLNKLCSVNLVNATLEEALQSVLGANAIAYNVGTPKSVFVYSDTPANREKHTWSVRAFEVLHADPAALVSLVYRELLKTSGTRPIIIAPEKPARTIKVRATGEKMALIAKLIADNDKQ